MAFIQHCGGRRRAETYFLNPSQEVADYCELEVVDVCFCPKCDKIIVEYCKFKAQFGRFDLNRAKQKDHDNWMARIRADLRYKQQAQHKAPRDSRAMIFVSEWTLKAARPADGGLK